MSLQALDARLVLVVPDLDLSIVRSRDDVGLVPAVVVVHTVHALLVALQREVGRRGAELPNFDGSGRKKRGNW